MSLDFPHKSTSSNYFLKPIKWILFVIIVAFVIHWPEVELRYKTLKTTTQVEPDHYQQTHRLILRESDQKDGLHSRMFQEHFWQEARTSGISPNELILQFDKPVLIDGLLISADCWKSTRLVEFAIGINPKPAYQPNSNQNMIFHVNFATNQTAGSIDEHIWFPTPYELEPQDSLNMGAWIQNISSKRQFVSPEMIIYYRWKE
ncbi:MAG: hypothetical protein A3G32_03985 [Deltaproteobacteria bacterium RIFCSPLOWO2_12_FULL_40_28]|nr:MAG: hypothetical protein A3C45_06070 [Deltaproteobacteria bacterium RIFCSPHIGHO2_02_FULL_40_28]OGQ20482.1 MAG: hypothetical protein A3E27_01865 [Deltaproteobacteria bacterium RIFCSPHIGHO2_12_FULL_40_32]OGQ41112.1 MAG: hypothetical protein A3I69_08730 [Deltaproteobacteria bacterium RIFCSPLOWO2_02_FULL_40_36]OGQ55092.1 MAG: hypothetical protein A3G32_03985 [Deltaproteobacteria bacterium RIFCSPLOWO2_12_FULL_40_28]